MICVPGALHFQVGAPKLARRQRTKNRRERHFSCQVAKGRQASHGRGENVAYQYTRPSCPFSAGVQVFCAVVYRSNRYQSSISRLGLVLVTPRISFNHQKTSRSKSSLPSFKIEDLTPPPPPLSQSLVIAFFQPPRPIVTDETSSTSNATNNPQITMDTAAPTSDLVQERPRSWRRVPVRPSRQPQMQASPSELLAGDG